jgi:hypothetical protein
MRMVLLPVVATGLIAVPAASLAATDPGAGARGSRLVERSALGHGPFERAIRQREARQREARRREARQRQRLAAIRAKRRATPPTPKVTVAPHLQAIAQCESGGNPHAIGGGGLYRGKYQFSYSTWAGVGGSGDPAAAPEAEQDMRAAILYERSGPGQWPVCGS